MNSNFNQPSFGGANLGKGRYNGFSTIQSQTGFRDTEIVNTRSILKRSWNGPYATGKYYGTNNVQYGRITTPFRAVTNSGDFLGRVNFVCGGSNINKGVGHSEWNRSMGSLINQCDSTSVPVSTCNPKYVYDSSDYVKYRRERSINQNFNDLKDGGFGSSRPIGSTVNNAYWNITGTR
jgi:hypothetical protein